VAEICQAGRALAQRELEGRDGSERRPQTENLQQLSRRSVGRDYAVPDAI
jgi:hypothetical protein